MNHGSSSLPRSTKVSPAYTDLLIHSPVRFSSTLISTQCRTALVSLSRSTHLTSQHLTPHAFHPSPTSSPTRTLALPDLPVLFTAPPVVLQGILLVRSHSSRPSLIPSRLPQLPGSRRTTHHNQTLPILLQLALARLTSSITTIPPHRQTMNHTCVAQHPHTRPSQQLHHLVLRKLIVIIAVPKKPSLI